LRSARSPAGRSAAECNAQGGCPRDRRARPIGHTIVPSAQCHGTSKLDPPFRRILRSPLIRRQSGGIIIGSFTEEMMVGQSVLIASLAVGGDGVGGVGGRTAG